MSDNSVKIELPSGFWTPTEHGRYIGTIHIGECSFHVEAIEVKRAVNLSGHGNAFVAVHRGQDQLDLVFAVSGECAPLRTIDIDRKPHVVFMTPYGA